MRSTLPLLLASALAACAHPAPAPASPAGNHGASPAPTSAATTPGSSDDEMSGGFGFGRAGFGPGPDHLPPSNGLDRNVVRAELEKQDRALQACVDANHDLADIILFDLVIDASGAVTSVTATVGDTDLDDTVEVCLAVIVRGIRFPSSQATTTTTIPYQLPALRL